MRMVGRRAALAEAMVAGVHDDRGMRKEIKEGVRLRVYRDSPRGRKSHQRKQPRRARAVNQSQGGRVMIVVSIVV